MHGVFVGGEEAPSDKSVCGPADKDAPQNVHAHAPAQWLCDNLVSFQVLFKVAVEFIYNIKCSFASGIISR